MRKRFFNILLAILEKHTPKILQSIQIQILLIATAAAFKRPMKMVWHLSPQKALAAYAAYTKNCMKEPAADRKRICRQAYRLGSLIRKISGFTHREELERLVFYLYGNIGIQMTGHLPGEVIIPSCYFSQIYKPDQCRTMSLMDRGVISGIFGGGRLNFSERLTEGHGRCRACLREKGRRK